MDKYGYPASCFSWPWSVTPQAAWEAMIDSQMVNAMKNGKNGKKMIWLIPPKINHIKMVWWSYLNKFHPIILPPLSHHARLISGQAFQQQALQQSSGSQLVLHSTSMSCLEATKAQVAWRRWGERLQVGMKSSPRKNGDISSDLVT